MRHIALVLKQGKEQAAKLLSWFADFSRLITNRMLTTVKSHKKTVGAALVGGAFLFSLPLINTNQGTSSSPNEPEQPDLSQSNQTSSEEGGRVEIEVDNDTDKAAPKVNGSGSSSTSITTNISTSTSSSSSNDKTKTYRKTVSSNDGNSSSTVKVTIVGNGESEVEFNGSSDSGVEFEYEDNTEASM